MISHPVFVNALYPIGAGIGPEAMEEGRVLVAIGRLASAKLTFVVDEPAAAQLTQRDYYRRVLQMTALLTPDRLS